jgi:hypothetical protein
VTVWREIARQIKPERFRLIGKSSSVPNLKSVGFQINSGH